MTVHRLFWAGLVLLSLGGVPSRAQDPCEWCNGNCAAYTNYHVFNMCITDENLCYQQCRRDTGGPAQPPLGGGPDVGDPMCELTCVQVNNCLANPNFFACQDLCRQSCGG